MAARPCKVCQQPLVAGHPCGQNQAKIYVGVLREQLHFEEDFGPLESQGLQGTNAITLHEFYEIYLVKKEETFARIFYDCLYAYNANIVKCMSTPPGDKCQICGKPEVECRSKLERESNIIIRVMGEVVTDPQVRMALDSFPFVFDHTTANMFSRIFHHLTKAYTWKKGLEAITQAMVKFLHNCSLDVVADRAH